MSRPRRTRHHRQTSRVHAERVLLWFLGLRLLLLAILVQSRVLLLLALALLHLDLGALFAVARTLVVQLVVLGYDLGFADFAVATTTGTAVY